MSAVDKAETEVVTAAHAARLKEAKEYHDAKEKNKVVKKWYELIHGQKLLLCKKKASGNVVRIYIGNVTKKNAASKALAGHVTVLEKKGNLIRR